LKDLLKQREDELETEKIAKKRALISEKKKLKIKGDVINKMQKEIESKASEIENLKRDNLNQSASNNNSRLFSPRAQRRLQPNERDMMTSEKAIDQKRKNRLDSPREFNITQNFTDNDSRYVTTNVSTRGHKKMKSSSPNRSGLDMSSKKVYVVTRLNNNRSMNRLHYIPNTETSVYDSHRHANGKYCEACKYKSWRINQLNYDPEKLLYNRDIIRCITCLGCEKAFEVKLFIKHARDCRLSNQIPHIDGSKYNNSKRFSNRDFSSNPNSKNKSERMDSENGDISNLRPNQIQSRNYNLTDRKLSTNLAKVKSNDNLLNKRTRRIMSGERFSAGVIEMSSDNDAWYNENSKQNEKSISDQNESSDKE